MENTPTITYLLISTAVSGYSAAVVWLVRRNDKLEQRLEQTNRETIEALRSAAKLGEKVPEMSVQLQQSSDENRLLRQRIQDLERRL
jgi:hypothetical protein